MSQPVQLNITLNFHVKNERVQETKAYIRTLPSLRFMGNPIEGRYYTWFTITSNCSAEIQQLQTFLHPEPKPEPPKSFWRKTIEFFSA